MKTITTEQLNETALGMGGLCGQGIDAFQEATGGSFRPTMDNLFDAAKRWGPITVAEVGYKLVPPEKLAAYEQAEMEAWALYKAAFRTQTREQRPHDYAQRVMPALAQALR